MTKTKNTKQTILKAALKEFATNGYGGTRMERIAKRAKINKAMLFYYYSSKYILYQNVVKQAFAKIFPQMAKIITAFISPKRFLEIVPKIHIQFLIKNHDLVKILSFDMLHNHKHISPIISEILGNLPIPGPKIIKNLIKKWHKKGLITEEDPLQFIFNLFSLTIFSIIGRPIFEKIFGEKPLTDEEFYQKRIQSIINLLKQGMLK